MNIIIIIIITFIIIIISVKNPDVCRHCRVCISCMASLCHSVYLLSLAQKAEAL